MQNAECKMQNLSIEALVEKRKARWKERHDMEYDRRIIEWNAQAILSNAHLREEVLKKPYLLIECIFCLVDKNKDNVPFFFNTVQKDFIAHLEKDGTKKPFFILKGRQQGFTTLITAIQLAYSIVKRNFSGFTLADRDENVKAIFVDKAKVMYNALPDILKPHEKFNSVNELFFDKLNSSWRVAPASANVGRSRTLSFIHYSEVAFYRCELSDLQKSINEAATPDAIRIYETTANGFNEAKDLWDLGSCVNLFYGWWLSDEYSSEDLDEISSADPWLSGRISMLRLKGLTEKQIAWYASKYNSYIDKNTIKQEYPCTPEEAFISSGDCIFDKEAISHYLTTFNIPFKKGYFTYERIEVPIKSGEVSQGHEVVIRNIEFREDRNGYIYIVDEPWKEIKDGVERIKPYVIGADTAGDATDYFAAKVIDNTNGRCVATLHKQRMDEDLFAEQLYCLGMYYNEAFIGVEINFSKQPVRILRQLGYTNLYVSTKLSTLGDTKEKEYGFITTSASRPIIISNMVTAMRENIRLETDRETLKEMTTFIRHNNGQKAATVGAHDDLVIASAIARFISNDYTHEITINKNHFADLTKLFGGEQYSEGGYIEW